MNPGNQYFGLILSNKNYMLKLSNHTSGYARCFYDFHQDLNIESG